MHTAELRLDPLLGAEVVAEQFLADAVPCTYWLNFLIEVTCDIVNDLVVIQLTNFNW